VTRGQNPLDTQNLSSYTPKAKKQYLDSFVIIKFYQGFLLFLFGDFITKQITRRYRQVFGTGEKGDTP
jgi:hypothetical protein